MDGAIVSLEQPDDELIGVATPDGAAIFLLDLSENYNTMLVIALKQPAATILSAGSYRIAGFGHEYLTNASTPPVEAMKQVWSGPWRITNRLDTGLLDDVRINTYDHVGRETQLHADNDLAVNVDGSLVWPAEESRGWFAASGKIAFLVPAEEVEGAIYPSAVDLRILTR